MSIDCKTAREGRGQKSMLFELNITLVLTLHSVLSTMDLNKMSLPAQTKDYHGMKAYTPYNQKELKSPNT